ncbi:MAG: hypothetical protein HY744_11195 [Deltaproteobacteria bacterium]|nr:hypothetical protein [Deltaproteobacteria bacterium]
MACEARDTEPEGGPATLRCGSCTERHARLPATPAPIFARGAEPIFDAWAALSDRAPVAGAPCEPDDEIPATVRTPRWGAAVAPAPTAVLQIAVAEAPADESPEQLGPQDISGFNSFFNNESFPPVVETHPEPEPEPEEPPDEPTPELLARRARLRKAVGGAVGVLALGLVAMLGQGPIARTVAAATARHHAPVPALAAAGALVTPVPAPSPTPSAGHQPGTKAVAPAVAAQVASPGQQDVRLETVRLLSHRELDQAAASARKLIAADPADAFGYLCLGAALQDQGKVAQAREIYVACHRRTTRGNRAECGALLNGGR